VLRIEDVSRTYEHGTEVVHAVDGVSVDVREGELVGLVGRSGSGKTTLLNLAAGWERPDRGRVEHPHGVSDPPRWREVAIVPQQLGLLEELSVRENARTPRWAADGSTSARCSRRSVSRTCGTTVVGRRSASSSGRRSRALLLRPRIDRGRASGHQTVDDRAGVRRLRDACDAAPQLHGTHDDAAKRLDRTLGMRDGRLVADHGSLTRQRCFVRQPMSAYRRMPVALQGLVLLGSCDRRPDGLYMRCAVLGRCSERER
jgi:putative ABC transport system ATP-binding protein